MSSYNNGAFCFYTAHDLSPADPEMLKARASESGLPESIVPEYAGDRASVSRAVVAARGKATSAGYVMGQLSGKVQSSACWGIMRRVKNVTQKTINDEHEAVVEWREGDTSLTGTHPVALLCDAEFQALRNKIVSGDWVASITNYILDTCYGTSLREDGRVYWIPPQNIAKIKSLQAYLKEVGIYLVLCEIDTANSLGIPTTVVRAAAEKSLSEQLADLKAEADDFDGEQKPSTYVSRLERYADLKRRANLYHEALGLAVDDAKEILVSLECKVDKLLDVRQNTVIRRKAKTGGGGSEMFGDDGDDPAGR